MSISKAKLEVIRWSLAAIAFGCVVLTWYVEVRGGWGVLLGAVFIIAGFPAAMLTLHLHPPKFFKYLERRR